MSRSVNHFKISNMPDSYTTTLVFISIIVFLVGGIGAVYSLITAFEIPDAIVAILVLTWLWYAFSGRSRYGG